MIYQNILSTHHKGIKKPELLPLFFRGGGGGRRFRLKYSFESLKEYTIVLNPRQAGGREEGVIQISYNWSPLLIYIANFTSHNFQQPLYRGREGRLVSLSIMRANVLVAEQV